MFRREKRKVQAQIGLSTKHSFITTVRNNADRGKRTAAYFSAFGAFCAFGAGGACDAFCCICIFCCTFRPFLLCFLAKRMFLKNLGSTCKRIGNFMNIGHNLQSYSNRAMTKKNIQLFAIHLRNLKNSVTKCGSEPSSNIHLDRKKLLFFFFKYIFKMFKHI